MAIFCSELRKEVSSNVTKTRRLQETVRWLPINNEKVETEEWNEQAQNVENSEDAATTIIKEYKDIIPTKKKNNVFLKKIGIHSMQDWTRHGVTRKRSKKKD